MDNLVKNKRVKYYFKNTLQLSKRSRLMPKLKNNTINNMGYESSCYNYNF